MSPHDLLLDVHSQRLALALLHFIWQGTLIAAVFSVAVEWFVRHPQRRYAAGVTALAAMAACLPITYWFIELPQNKLVAVADRSTEARATVLDNESPAQAFVAASDPLAEFSSVGHSTAQFQAESVTDEAARGRAELFGRIVLVWLIGVVAFSLRLVGGAVGLRMLTRRTSPAPCEYVNLMERFGRTMRLGRLPRLVVSSRVTEAIASGFFRPVIVFPAAWLAELPPAVIEAVLAHELAHVRRYDLWVNLLQRAVEAVCFYHPAVWWISRQVRSDREMCCDELAVAATGQKVAYVSALEVVARRAAREPLFSLAPGIGGRKMHLLERVRHVLGLPTQRQPGGWWAAGVLALAVPCGLWALSGPAAPRALAQEERDEGDRDREDRDADREREEREERDERVREERDEREERGDRARDEADRDEQRVRREVEVRERGNALRGVRERREVIRRNGDVDVEVDIRRDERGRDPGPRASAEAQRQRALQRANEAQQKQQQQARQQLERAREQLERQMAEMRARLGERLRGAEERGEREVVEAVRREMEAANRQAEDQVRALERQREDLAARFRDADGERSVAQRALGEQERAAAQRARAEQAEIGARTRNRAEGIDPQTVREMAAAVKALRDEVQQLRREVRELREGATRKDAPKKDPQPKGEASLILESVPYVGRLFPKEKQPKKADPKPKVSVDFDGKKVESGDLKLELKLEGKDLQNLQKDLEKLQKVYADQIKSADIEFKKAADKLYDVKVELKKDQVEKLKDVKVEFDKAGVEKLKDVIIELKEKVGDVELKLDKSPKDVKVEFKKSPVEKIKDVEIEFKKAPVEKTKEAVIEFKKSIADEVKKAELDVKKALDKLKSDEVTVEYATKAAQVAKMELQKALEATRKVPGAISEIDLEQMKHVQKRALQEVERAKQDLLQQTSKLKDDLTSQTLQDDLAKRLSELKHMVELSTAKDKISKVKQPEKVIKKEEKVEIKFPTK